MRVREIRQTIAESRRSYIVGNTENRSPARRTSSASELAGSSWTASTRADGGARRRNANISTPPHTPPRHDTPPPRKQRLDAAVPAVAHPALELACHRLVLDPGAVADALHPAPDRHPTDCFVHLFLKPEKFCAAHPHLRVAGDAARQLGRRKA